MTRTQLIELMTTANSLEAIAHAKTVFSQWMKQHPEDDHFNSPAWNVRETMQTREDVMQSYQKRRLDLDAEIRDLEQQVGAAFEALGIQEPK